MKEETHRRVLVTEHGGPEVLEVIEEGTPVPASGEIRVRTLAAGVSGLDVMVRQHRFPGFPKVPFTPGTDVVGRVDEVGEDVSTVEEGQVVAALLGFNGAYAESVCMPAEEAVAVAGGVDPAEAVCLPAN